MTRTDSSLQALAQRQYGLLTAQQARAEGLRARQIAERVQAGTWRWVIAHTVLAIAGAPATTRFWQMVALLHCGPGAALSHRSAARLHDIWLPGPDQQIWVTVPFHRQPRALRGIRVTRSRGLDGFTTAVEGLSVTTPARTVVDLGAYLTQEALLHVIHDVVRRGLATPEQVATAADAVSRRKGVHKVRGVLAEFDPTYESGLEALAGRLFARAGLRLTRQYRVCEAGHLIARLDFADEELKVGIEVDGVLYHSSLTDMRRDRRRDEHLATLGWVILRFTTDDLLHRPDWVVRRILEVLDQRRRGKSRVAG